MNLKLWLVALKRYFQKPPEFRADADHAQDAPGEPDMTGEPDSPPVTPPEDEPGEKPAAGTWRSRKRIFIAGAAGLLMVSLAVIIMVSRTPSPPPEKSGGTAQQEDAKHAAQDTAQAAPEKPAAQHGDPKATAADHQAKRGNDQAAPSSNQAELEALKQENAALQAQIDALRNAQPRQPPGKAGPSPASGEMTLGNEDAKATAMTLKQAIESMNAATGDYREKPANGRNANRPSAQGK